jgi:hypothetical protein
LFDHQANAGRSKARKRESTSAGVNPGSRSIHQSRTSTNVDAADSTSPAISVACTSRMHG